MNPHVPDGCPVSPWEEENIPFCATCGEPIVEGQPHIDCLEWE